VQFLYEAGLIAKGRSIVDLDGADLSGAYLGGASLSGAYLSRADLSGGNLREANLSGAAGCTEEQLDQAGFLTGATMPNGQKDEDWLKSKDRAEDGENE